MGISRVVVTWFLLLHLSLEVGSIGWDNALVLSLSYMILHRLYLTKSQTYRDELSRDQQVVVLQHSIEALFLGLIWAPFTYVILSVFFEEQPLDSLGNKVTALVTFMACVGIMYLIELASRFANPRPLVVAHHLCAYLLGAVTMFLPTTANVKGASILIYFVTFESITFCGLVMYKLAPTHWWTRPVIWAW